MNSIARFSRRALVLVPLVVAAACERSPSEPASQAVSHQPRAELLAAATPAGFIRIGVIPDAGTILIGATGDYTLRDKVTGATLVTSSADQTEVTALAANTHKSYRLQVLSTTSTAARDARVALAQSLGYVTYVEPYLQYWRVLIDDQPLTTPYGTRLALTAAAIAKGVAASDAYWRIITVGEPTMLQVRHGALTTRTANPVVVEATSGSVKIGTLPYRGTGEVRINSSLTLAGVNELPLEEYLYGVVPRELGPVAYPELEALKAQAVAARTYALSGLNKHANDGYDLTATTSDQVYGGLSAEHPLSTQAVDATHGIVATYGGALISALYHSTSGGWTADNDEAYNAAPSAYLRGIVDAQRGQAPEHVPSLDVFRNRANARSLRASHEGDFDSDWGRLHRWTYDWTNDEIRTVLSAYYQQDVGAVREINVLERGPSGRVLSIEFVTENGTFTGSKDRIRQILQYVNASNVLNWLPSTLFYVEPVLDHKGKQLAGFQVWGGGYGHGVGLSQTGAVGMAQKGATYEEILHHYYQGIALEQR